MEPGRIRLNPLLAATAGILLLETAAALTGLAARWGAVAATGGLRLAQTALVVMIFSGTGPGLASLGLTPDNWRRGLKNGLVWSAGFAAAAALAGGACLAAGIDPMAYLRTPVPARAGDRVIMLLVAGLIGPAAEEVYFRGVIYGFFRRWGIAAAMAGSGVLFVAAHTAGAGQIPVTQIVGALVFAAAYEITGSLVAPITVHVLGNLALMGISLVVGGTPA